MPKLKNEPQKAVNPLTKTYLQKLSTKELSELFTFISNQFTARLNNCKEIVDLKDLQAYLRLISEEIKARDSQ